MIALAQGNPRCFDEAVYLLSLFPNNGMHFFKSPGGGKEWPVSYPPKYSSLDTFFLLYSGSDPRLKTTKRCCIIGRIYISRQPWKMRNDVLKPW